MKITDIQNQILSVLQHGYGGEWCYNYSQLEGETKLDRATLQKEIKELKRLGLVVVEHGLMTDDGEVAGSGFTIPYLKMKELDNILKY